MLWRCPTLHNPSVPTKRCRACFQVRNVAGRFPGVTATRLFVQRAPPPVFWWGCGVDRGLRGCGCFAAVCSPERFVWVVVDVGPLVPVGSHLAVLPPLAITPLDQGPRRLETTS